MISSSTFDAFPALVCLGIGHAANDKLNNIDWQDVLALAEQQGLNAIVLDGIEQIKSLNIQGVQGPPQDLLLEWIGEVLQDYESMYELYSRTIAEMAHFYNSHGYKMMVLKGYACSLDWPKPDHRPCGDIDIWLFGKQKEADALLSKEKGIKIDNSHHHHTVFDWGEFMVENHYDFINVHHHKSNKEFDKYLKELGSDDSYYIEVYGEKVYLPSPDLNALFLLKHMMMHFASEEITLRQLLDWAFFVEKHGKNVDWTGIIDIIERFGMKPAFEIFNAICVEDLGFDSGIFPHVQCGQSLKDKVMREILSPEFGVELPQEFYRRVLFKLRRWRGSIWKHELCYSESRWSAFWSGVWNHLLKPSSI